jgi:hypothetical protein
MATSAALRSTEYSIPTLLNGKDATPFLGELTGDGLYATIGRKSDSQVTRAISHKDKHERTKRC